MRIHTGSTRYDRSVIQQHVDALNAEADRIALHRTLSGALVGGALGLGVWAALSVFLPAWAGWGPALAGGVTVYGALAGWAAGLREGFPLRLEAQGALCQMMIERNTSELL